MSEASFILLLQGIRYWYDVNLNKISLCPDKTETLQSSMKISISECFSVLVLLLDKLVLEIDLDLFTVFSVSVIWLEPDLSNNLILSVLLLLGVLTVFLDACDCSVLLFVSIFFFLK